MSEWNKNEENENFISSFVVVIVLVLEWFWPNHRNRLTAKRYTGRLNIKHMIQQRQLRVDHPDTHYCNAVFR